jgi:hypothetical protein
MSTTQQQTVTGAIFKAMPAIMGEVGAVAKGRKNLQQGYQFRGIDDLYSAVQLVMAKHGVSVAPSVEEIILREERQTKNGGAMFHMIVKIRHRFHASDGSFIDTVTLGEAMDTGDKTSNKVMSVAMKYALIEAFCIPTESDDDTENHSPDVAPRQSQHREEHRQAPASTAPPPRRDDERAVYQALERAASLDDVRAQYEAVKRIVGDAKDHPLRKAYSFARARFEVEKAAS